ncbi:MAG TPA: class I SAM-dependent methyltransferase, partial [Afipia sp.]
LRKYCPNLSSFLEIGCGTGYVLEGISKQAPSATLIGSEMLVSGLRLATERQIPRSQFLQMDARKIPFKSEFDAIGLFDVLEHIKEDIDSLVGIREALLPNGLIFLTVPQHKWLWSDVDVYAHHQRRYNSDELNDKLISSGFKVVRSTSFVTSLLPAMLASRALGKRSQSSDGAEFAISPILNAIFLRMMEVEVALISKNINFPFGGSRLVVAQRLP